MRVRGQRDREFEGAVDYLFAVLANEAVQGPLQKPTGLLVGPFPIGRVRDAEFNKNGGETRRGCIAAE